MQKGNKGGSISKKFLCIAPSLMVALLLINVAGLADPKVLVVGHANSAGDINPLIGQNIMAEYVCINTYDTLVLRAATTSPQGYPIEDPYRVLPGLATSWTISDDGLTYTFHLRRDVKFHNGNEFDSADVVYYFNLLRTVGSYASMFGDLIESVTASDKYTVTMVLSHPDPQFLRRISTYNGCIPDSETLIAEAGEDVESQMAWLASHEAGSGPFILEELTTDRVRLVANPNYWRGRPNLDEVVLLTVPEPGNLKMLVERGDLSIAVGPARTDYPSLEANPDIDLVVRPGNSKVCYIGMNVTEPPFDDVRVRKAIAHAIPYNAIRSVVGGGDKYAPRATSLVTSDLPGHVPAFRFDYDLEKARELLSEAGYPNGLDVEFDLFNVSSYNKVAVMLKAELQKIGVNMTIVPMAPPAFFSAGAAGSLKLFVVSWWDNAADPVALLRQIAHSSSIPANGNWACFADPEVDSLIDRAAVEMDPAVRDGYVAAVQEILAAQVPYVPLWEAQIIFAARKNVKGYIHYSDALFRFFDMDLE